MQPVKLQNIGQAGFPPLAESSSLVRPDAYCNMLQERNLVCTWLSVLRSERRTTAPLTGSTLGSGPTCSQGQTAGNPSVYAYSVFFRRCWCLDLVDGATKADEHGCYSIARVHNLLRRTKNPGPIIPRQHLWRRERQRQPHAGACCRDLQLTAHIA